MNNLIKIPFFDPTLMGGGNDFPVTKKSMVLFV
jgi:hypothetical protein